jgi:hypothetical protein
MMAVLGPSETSVNIYQTTGCTIAEDSHLQFVSYIKMDRQADTQRTFKVDYYELRFSLVGVMTSE